MSNLRYITYLGKVIQCHNKKAIDRVFERRKDKNSDAVLVQIGSFAYAESIELSFCGRTYLKRADKCGLVNISQ